MTKRKNRIGLISLLIGAAGYAVVIFQPWVPLNEIVVFHHLTLKSLLAAFFDASLVGALADWFAVSALFRNPLGISLPHTDILAKNKDAIAEAVPKFLTSFVSEERISQELAGVDFGGRILAFARQGEKGWDELHSFLRSHLSPLLARQGSSQGAEALRNFVKSVLDLCCERLDFAALFSRLLGWASENHYDESLIEAAAGLLRDEVGRNVTGLARGITPVLKRNAGWQGIFVGQGTVEKLLHGLQAELGNIRSSPDHALRVWLRSQIQAYTAALSGGMSDPVPARERFNARMEGILQREDVLDGSVLFLSSILSRLGAGLSSSGSSLFRALESLERTFEAQIDSNAAFRASFNKGIAELTAGIIAQSRLIESLTGYFTALLKNTDERIFVLRVEESVWNDLQYIRLNGAVVGGIVGLALGILSAFL